MNNKKISSFISLLFVGIFILWINGCEYDLEKDGHRGTKSECRGASIGAMVERPYAGLKANMEYRTGQSLEGWTYAELIALEEELNRLEEERKTARWKEEEVQRKEEAAREREAMKDSEAKKEDGVAYYEDNEEDLAYGKTEDTVGQETLESSHQQAIKALEGRWKGSLYGSDSMKVYITQHGEKTEGWVEVEGGPLEFQIEVPSQGEAVVYASGQDASGEQGVLYYDDQTKKVQFTLRAVSPGSSESVQYYFEGIVSKDGSTLKMNGDCTIGIYAGEGNMAVLQWEASLIN